MEPTISKGIYTISEVSKLLKIRKHRIRRWLHAWSIEDNYHSYVDNFMIIDFLTFIELNVVNRLNESGVPIKAINKARRELSKNFHTKHPFAYSKILNCINTDGKHIFFETSKGTVSLDGKYQFQISFIRVFFKQLKFNKNQYVAKYYPLGKKKDVEIDPKRSFGQPIIKGTNINPNTIYSLFKAGETKNYIKKLYELNSKQVNDAIKFCRSLKAA